MNTNTAKFLFEGISADVVRYLVERNDMDLQEAISTFHNSETFVKLEDFSTGLYIESPAYVYDLLMSELKTESWCTTIGHYLSSGHFILQSILQFPVKADW